MVTVLSIKCLASPRTELRAGPEASDVIGPALPPAPSNVLGQPTQTSVSPPTDDGLDARRVHPILLEPRADPTEVPALAWWRTIPRCKLGPTHAAAIDKILGNVALAGGLRWEDAVHGDAAAAIANALRLFPIATASVRIDLVMTAVLRAAIDGDLAADMVILKAVRDYDGRRRSQHDRRPA